MDARWRLTLKNLFFPVFCRECGAPVVTEDGGCFCPSCWESSPRIEPPLCVRCGRPLTERVGFDDPGYAKCGDCRTAKTSACDGIRGAALYEGAVAEAIKLFKFSQRLRLAEPLVRELRRAVDTYLDANLYDCLVPVPLHRVRLRERGFNQSERLAQGVEALFPRAGVETLLERVRPTRVQSRLRDPGERLANIRGAFRVSRPEAARGAAVLLVDDVITTGATVEECARVLKDAGARRVDVLAVALASTADYGLEPKGMRKRSRRTRKGLKVTT
jgi:ComF family protein